jgi:hypothetical protein
MTLLNKKGWSQMEKLSVEERAIMEAIVSFLAAL